MKARITRVILSILTLLLLNSCIVKSLFPFFTKDTIHFEKALLGIWIDDEKGIWEIQSFKEQFLKENIKHEVSELSKEDLEIYNTYKGSYYVNYIEKNNEALYVATPFKLNNELFIDFTLAEINKPELNILTILHLNPIHTLAKFEILEDNKLSVKWMDETKINELLEQKKIKIKHEKIGFDNSYLLTSSSEELQKFIKKYMASTDGKKWSTDIKFDLQRKNDKP